MNEQEMDFRINCILARARNIIYYRRIDNRPRCQYIHTVRGLRQDTRTLSLSLPNTEKYKDIKELFGRIVRTIPPKVKSEECEEVIMKVAEILMTPEEIQQLQYYQFQKNKFSMSESTNIEQLKTLLSILNNEGWCIQTKFEAFIGYPRKSEILDIIDDSPYSSFIDIFYQYGEELCRSINYDVLYAAYDLKRTLGSKEYKEYVKTTRKCIEVIVTDYKISNIVASVNPVLRDPRENLQGYFGTIRISSVDKIFLNGMKPQLGIGFSDYIDFLKVIFRKDWKFVIDGNKDKLFIYKRTV